MIHVPTFRNPFRHVERPHCDDAQATLDALIQPSGATAQREAFRSSTRDAMLREFDRAAAPTKEPLADVRNDVDDAPLVSVGGMLLSDSLERIEDPEAVAAAVREIIANHRARVQ